MKFDAISELQQRQALERLMVLEHLQQVSETGQMLEPFFSEEEQQFGPGEGRASGVIHESYEAAADGIVVERDFIGSHLSCDLPAQWSQEMCCDPALFHSYLSCELPIHGSYSVDVTEIEHHLVCDISSSPRWVVSEIDASQYLRCQLQEPAAFSLALGEALQYLRCDFPEMTMALERLIQAAGIIPAEHWSCALPDKEVSVDEAMEVLGIRSMTQLSCDVDYSRSCEYEKLLSRQMQQQEKLVRYLDETLVSGESLLLSD